MSALLRLFVQYVSLFPAVVALSWIVLGLVFVLRREWRLPLDAGFEPGVVVVIPAHDEELVIERALTALLAQDYPAAEIHVVSDGSSDRTAELARRFASRGVIVHERHANAGKSASLQYVLERVDSDLFFVVDADTEAQPGALRHAVQAFADPRVGAVTGHARVGNASRPLTAMQAMEYSVIVGLAKRAEQFWGGLYTVTGAAACFRTAALREVGGWSVATVTEDIEVSWRLQRTGWALVYDPRAVFLIQAPVRLRALYRQRRRWARGMVEVLRLHPNILATRIRGLIPIAAMAVGAGLWMLLATALLISGLASVLLGAPESAAWETMHPTEWKLLFLWTFGLFALQALVATLFDSAHAAGVWRVLPLLVVFPFYFWLVLYPSFVVGATEGLSTRRSTRWARTERTATLPSRFDGDQSTTQAIPRKPSEPPQVRAMG
jgi:biofilm PGA synthesis N-glycosyltransferase PgaC